MSELLIWGFDVAIGDMKTKIPENESMFFPAFVMKICCD